MVSSSPQEYWEMLADVTCGKNWRNRLDLAITLPTFVFCLRGIFALTNLTYQTACPGIDTVKQYLSNIVFL